MENEKFSSKFILGLTESGKSSESIRSERLGGALTKIQEQLPQIAFDKPTQQQIDSSLIQRIDKIFETFIRDENYRDIHDGLRALFNVLRIRQNKQLGLGEEYLDEEKIPVFESYFATFYLLNSVEQMKKMVGKNVPTKLAHRISGIVFPRESYYPAEVAIRKKENLSFKQIINHEERHVWNSFFKQSWQYPPTRKLLPEDVQNDSMMAGVELFYSPRIQNFLRDEMNAFFVENMSFSEIRRKFLDDYMQDNYNFADPRLYRDLRLTPKLPIFGKDFRRHYELVINRMVDRYQNESGKLELYPNKSEYVQRQAVANKLLFTELI